MVRTEAVDVGSNISPCIERKKESKEGKCIFRQNGRHIEWIKDWSIVYNLLKRKGKNKRSRHTRKETPKTNSSKKKKKKINEPQKKIEDKKVRALVMHRQKIDTINYLQKLPEWSCVYDKHFVNQYRRFIFLGVFLKDRLSQNNDYTHTHKAQ